MLPDRSLLIGQKLVENAKNEQLKCDILSNFQTFKKMRLLVFFSNTVFFPVFEFHSRSETLRFKSSQSQLCFVHSSQFSTLEVSGGQIGFFQV